LQSICIPRNVEIFSKLCFARSKLKLITFESESRLTRIEDLCFSNCSLENDLYSSKCRNPFKILLSLVATEIDHI
jgi:hypothetical protein